MMGDIFKVVRKKNYKHITFVGKAIPKGLHVYRIETFIIMFDSEGVV
jgi:hypothetical protein